MQENMIKLIAIDLDGTLLNRKGQIDEPTAKAVRRAAKQGTIIVISTGRPIEEVPEEQLNGIGVRYVVALNGAAIYKMPEGKCIAQRTMPAEQAASLIEELSRLEVYPDVFAGQMEYGLGDREEMLEDSDRINEKQLRSFKDQLHEIRTENQNRLITVDNFGKGYTDLANELQQYVEDEKKLIEKAEEDRQSVNMMDIALHIAFHLECGMPVFESEHRAPVNPEIGAKHFVVKYIRDFFIVQFFIRRKEQSQNFLLCLVGKSEFLIGVRILSAFFGDTAKGVVRILFVQPVVFIQHADSRGFDGGNGAEQIPHALKMVIHFAAAPHYIADVRVIIAVAGAARQRFFLQNVDIPARHLSIADKETGRGKSCKSGADNIR